MAFRYMVAQYLLSNSKIGKSFKEEKNTTALHIWGPLRIIIVSIPFKRFSFWICYHSTCTYHQEHNVFCVDTEESSEPRESTRTQALH